MAPNKKWAVRQSAFIVRNKGIIMISTSRERYALMAVFGLALKYNSDNAALLQLDEIAEQHEIPKGYLLQIMRQLGVAGILHSARGPKGGYKLTRQPSEISFGDVVRALNGHRMTLESPNMSHMPERLDAVWKNSMQEMMSVLDRKTFADVIESA